MSAEAIWEVRNTMLLEEITHMSPDARRIKLADRLSNIVESMKTRTGHKLERYIRQTRQILDAIPRDTSPALWDAIQAALPKESPGGSIP